MHVFIELWNPKPSWASLSMAERKKFMEVVGGLTRPVIEQEGIDILGWAVAGPAVDHRGPYKFFAVYQAKRADSFASIQKAIADGGWYTHFDQVNVVGELVPPPGIIEHHIKNDT